MHLVRNVDKPLVFYMRTHREVTGMHTNGKREYVHVTAEAAERNLKAP